jgi:hypothetical protein
MPLILTCPRASHHRYGLFVLRMLVKLLTSTDITEPRGTHAPRRDWQTVRPADLPRGAEATELPAFVRWRLDRFNLRNERQGCK